MSDESNPYRPPAVPQTDAPPEFVERPATECPYCAFRVTFFQSLRQPTPFSFRCAQCGHKLKVRLRGPLKLGIYGFAVALMIAVGGTLLAVRQDRFWIPIAMLPVLVIAWLGLEVLTYRNLKANAKFLVRRDPVVDKEA